jgi:hypothetical protein
MAYKQENTSCLKVDLNATYVFSLPGFASVRDPIILNLTCDDSNGQLFYKFDPTKNADIVNLNFGRQ